jgi:hypothetical protein
MMRIALLLVAVAFPFGALAGASPSDIDLRASYCVAIVKNRAQTAGNMAARMAPDHPARSQIEDSVKRSSDDLARLRSYLAPKMQNVVPEEMLLALQRGERDARAISQVSRACAARCENELDNGRPNAKWLACTDRCLAADPLSVRLASCKTLDWLP